MEDARALRIKGLVQRVQGVVATQIDVGNREALSSPRSMQMDC